VSLFLTKLKMLKESRGAEGRGWEKEGRRKQLIE
jgi:hypothetical protein